MNFTLHQLRVFLEVAKHESITRAAESLYLTQPAVSIQLKNLQEQFDIPLTEVIGRKLSLTDFGMEMVEAAKKILREVETVNELAFAYKGMLTGRLSISVVSTGKYVMPYFLSGFTRSQEGIDLVMDVTNRAQVIRSLELNEPDFALVSVLPDKLRVEREELMANQLQLISSPALVSGSGPFTPSVMEENSLIFREKGSATRMAMERYIAHAGIQVNRKLELTSNEAVKQAVIAGLGLSVMPLIGIRQELQSGALTIVKLPDFPITTYWNLIWLKGKKHSPAAKAFLEYVKEAKEEVIKTFFQAKPSQVVFPSDNSDTA